MARSAVIVFLVGLTVAHVVGQAADFELKKFGSLSVSDDEVAQIADLVSSTGKRPWLLESPHTGEMDVRIAYLFLEPDVAGARVHRGQVLMLGADGPRFGPPRSPWRLQESR